MKEYDTIVLKTEIDDGRIPAGTRGVILMVFETPSKAYEVELVDASNQSLGTFTVRGDQIEEMN